MGTKFSKADLIDNVYEALGFDRQEIKEVIDHFLAALGDVLSAGNSVEIRGFGGFETRIRKGRVKVRNPRTGETRPGQEHGVVWFKPGKGIRRAVWNVQKGADGTGEPPPTA
jgi:integration host factor subunit beta